MKFIFSLLLSLCSMAAVLRGQSFNDTTGNIEVNGAGQLQFTLPIALPSGVKSVAPQINLVYTSSSGNGIAGYGWNLSGVTAISRIGKSIEKDSESIGVQLNRDDYFQYNGQRLVVESGDVEDYGRNGTTYLTDKYSNIRIKSVGNDYQYPGPQYFEVNFEDGSQAIYGNDGNNDFQAQSPTEFNITKWKDPQGNTIVYRYMQVGNVSMISKIEWGGNDALNTPHFNEIVFDYQQRSVEEINYVKGLKLYQYKLLKSIQVNTNGTQFKKYEIKYKKSENGALYDLVESVKEFNSAGQEANPVVFGYLGSSKDTRWQSYNVSDNNNKRIVGDFNGDGKLDYLKWFDQGTKCVEWHTWAMNGSDAEEQYSYNKEECAREESTPVGMYLIRSIWDGSKPEIVFSGLSHLTKSDFETGTAITIKNKNGSLVNGQGVAMYQMNGLQNGKYDIKVLAYSINTSGQAQEEYIKIIPNQAWDNGSTAVQNPQDVGFTTVWPRKINSVDLDGDGISEVMLDYDISCSGYVPYPMCKRSYTYGILELNNKSIEDSYSHLGGIPAVKGSYDLTNVPFSLDRSIKGDFDGDNRFDRINYYLDDNVTITKTRKSYSGLYYTYNQPFSVEGGNFKGLVHEAVLGDFNGDSKTDILIPQAEDSSDWILYTSTGTGFSSQYLSGFERFKRWESNESGGRSSVYSRSYAAQDLNKDGKTDLVVFENHTRYLRVSGQYSQYKVAVHENMGQLGSSGITFKRVSLRDFEPSNTVDGPEPFGMLVGDFKINDFNKQIVIVRKNRMDTFSYYDFAADVRINNIRQGEVTTIINYRELDPSINPGFYSGNIANVQYPYMEMARASQSYAVSRMEQMGKVQDFKYRGFTANLNGRGIIGFRQAARSSWYVTGAEGSKIWQGVETDPLNDGVPIKEWSIRTNDDNKIFPANLSENNTELLNFKTTAYKTDLLIFGNITSVNGPLTVTARVPLSTRSKDFLTGTVADESITYGKFYLPAQKTTVINGNYAITTSTFEYTHNVEGTGTNYYIGRPKSKTDVVQAYGDTKSAKEEYFYESNLLKTLKIWNRDNTGWIQEVYQYDPFGNITEKNISNTIDNQIQTTKAQYDPKGRFAIKTTDNIGLETHVTYNDLGQILTQTDPLGNRVANSYDAWGKLLSSASDLSGTTTYTYERFEAYRKLITQYDPDGNISKKYLDDWGREYRNSTKAFGQGQFTSQDIQFDGLGRKIKESEPYFEGQSASQWNIIAYDDSVFPAKVTVTSFNGKQVETTVSGLTTVVKELNGYGRTNSKTNDAIGNIVSSSDKGGTISFWYNAAGEQISAQYAENIVTTKYDIWGRKSEFNDPSNGLYKYEYDGFGQPKKIISPKGVKEYSYNNLGQLVTQKEFSSIDGGQTTDKAISFIYNNLGQLTVKSGTSKGNAYNSEIIYDSRGRMVSLSENSNGKSYAQKDIVYDDKGRVVSYEKSLSSSGIVTKAQVENLYSAWNGDLYQIKDKNSGRVLWELKETNLKGQVLKSKLGEANISNTYDANDFLSSINHSSAIQPGILQLSYTFDAVKNELKSRVTAGDFNITESFDYDDNNRLINWTDPVTGVKPSGNRNIYDDKGRILENDQIGTIKYQNGQKVYQPTAMTLNSLGVQNYNNDLIQEILYNENNDPVFINGEKGDVAFQYGLSGMRQKVTFGGNFSNTGEGGFTKFYSEDGSFEIIRNNGNGTEKHILYIGGNPYESNIVYLKDYTESSGSYKFLHKDYLGSILAISDESGNKLEQRHFDAWGNFTHLKIGNGAVVTDKTSIENYALLIGRGYTSHENFAEVGIIHMNGRLYDPLLRRFLNADENIQDMFNTQNYNKYGYVLNNPMMFADPSGELIWFVIGAAAVISGYMTGVKANGSWNPFEWDWKKTGWQILGGAAVGAIAGATGAWAGQAAAVFAASSLGVSGGILGGAITGFVGGAVGGAVSGLGDALIFREDIGRGVVRGLVTGAVVGGVIGGVTGGISQAVNNAKVTSTGIGAKGNIITGNPVVGNRSVWSLNNTPKVSTVNKIKPVSKITVGDFDFEVEITSKVYDPATESFKDVTKFHPFKAGDPTLATFNPDGSFSISDWSGYPSNIPKPDGPFRLIGGAEYEAARKAANLANQAMRKANPAFYKGMEIHEIHPIKYGGSPTNPLNKIVIPAEYHRKIITPWWNNNMNSIKKIP